MTIEPPHIKSIILSKMATIRRTAKRQTARLKNRVRDVISGEKIKKRKRRRERADLKKEI